MNKKACLSSRSYQQAEDRPGQESGTGLGVTERVAEAVPLVNGGHGVCGDVKHRRAVLSGGGGHPREMHVGGVCVCGWSGGRGAYRLC